MFLLLQSELLDKYVTNVEEPVLPAEHTYLNFDRQAFPYDFQSVPLLQSTQVALSGENILPETLTREQLFVDWEHWDLSPIGQS